MIFVAGMAGLLPANNRCPQAVQFRGGSQALDAHARPRAKRLLYEQSASKTATAALLRGACVLPEELPEVELPPCDACESGHSRILNASQQKTGKPQVNEARTRFQALKSV